MSDVKVGDVVHDPALLRPGMKVGFAPGGHGEIKKRLPDSVGPGWELTDGHIAGDDGIRTHGVTVLALPAPPEEADPAPVGSRWRRPDGGVFRVSEPHDYKPMHGDDLTLPIVWEDRETMAGGGRDWARPDYVRGCTRLDVAPAAAHGGFADELPTIGAWYRSKSHPSVIAEYLRKASPERHESRTPDGETWHTNTTGGASFFDFWEGPVPGPIGSGAAAREQRERARRAVEAGKLAPTASAPIHDFTDRYAVMITVVDGQKHMGRVCSRCGSDQGKHERPKCEPHNWRAEDDRLTEISMAPSRAGRNGIKSDLPEARPTAVPPQPMLSGFGALAGPLREGR